MFGQRRNIKARFVSRVPQPFRVAAAPRFICTHNQIRGESMCDSDVYGDEFIDTSKSYDRRIAIASAMDESG